MGKFNFTYDPLVLSRLTLQIYVEKFIEGKFYKAKQFACYDYLTNLTDSELETLLLEYVKRESLEHITFENWEDDAKKIFEIIFESKAFKELEFNFKKMGYGLTGLGVVDKSDNTFYDCGLTQHWKEIKNILQNKHPELYDALDELQFKSGCNVSSNGVTREYLDNFIIKNFELIGGSKDLEFYLED